MDALIFIVDSLLTLAVYAFLLRLLLQLSRADFRNPIAQAVLRLTSWLVLPLRKLLPPLGRLDTASLVAVLLAQVAATAVVFMMLTGVAMPRWLISSRFSFITTVDLTSSPLMPIASA